MQPTAKKLVELKLIENDIHIFTPLNNNRAAIDAFFEALWEAQKDLEGDVIFRFMVDTSLLATPPFAYFLEKNRQWVQAHPKLKPNRAAILIAKSNPFRSLLVTLANLVMLRAISKLEAHIFYLEERETAIAWLIKGN